MADSNITLREASRSIWFWVPVALLPVALLVPPYLNCLGVHVSVGIYIGIFGLLAAGVTLRKEPSMWEKGTWMIVLCIFMGAEMRNVIVADKEQSATFGAISDSLKATRIGLDAAATKLQGISGDINTAAVDSKNQFHATMSQVSEAINNETGNGSFCYIDLGSVSDAGGYPLLMHKGKYTIRSVVMSVTNMQIWDAVAKAYPHETFEHRKDSLTVTDIGTVWVTGHRGIGGDMWNFYDPGKGKQDYHIVFTAVNGSWEEYLKYRKVGNQWERAIRVIKEGERNHLAMPDYIDKGYPAKDGKVDWGSLD